MNKRRSLVILTVLAALAAPVVPTGAALGADRDDVSGPGPAVLDVFDRSRAEGEGFMGTDGLHHDSAPQVVVGLNGELYYGADFDVACAFGKKYVRSLEAITKLAEVIHRSGRRVVWTVTPSKTSVVDESLDVAGLPHGDCDRRGLRQQRKLIESYTDPWFLPLLGRLASDPRQMYWKTDPHWTTVGGAVFAKRLANALDPRLGRLQRYRPGTQTAVGLFNVWRGDDTPETAQAAFPRTSVKVRSTAGSGQVYTTFPDLVFDHSWVSKPAKLTWPGRTVLIGDSMAIYALENLRPIFRRGRYMWIDYAKRRDLLEAIVDSDTVVLEIFQTFAPFRQGLTSADLRQAVAKALRRDSATD